MTRPRFTLRTLLMAVAVCALVSGGLSRRVRWQFVRPGMSVSTVRSIMGEPVYRDAYPAQNRQFYRYEMGGVLFERGVCVQITALHEWGQ